MIPNVPVNSEVIKDGIEDSMSFSLDAASTAHILNMLRSGVYKDPKMACIREYWCNARDSVVEAGGDLNKDVIITLPSARDPYLKIQDFGVGLSETDFRRIFRKYGASTKRESNEQIGQLGIGSKSAFSYSDTYTITATKNGIKRVFIATVARDSVTADGIGTLNKVMEVDTDERNGIEISIPVKEKDMRDFSDKISFFFAFVPASQRPTFKGDPFLTISERYHEDMGVENIGWRLNGQGRSYAIMGGVPYNLDDAAMDTLSEGEKGLIRIGVDIEFGIGEIDPAISREELRYTEHTLKKLREKIKFILESFSVKIEEKIQKTNNLWEAKWCYRGLSCGMWAKIIDRCLKKNSQVSVTWKGHVIDDYQIGIRQDPYRKSDSIYLIKVYRAVDGTIKRVRQDDWTVSGPEQPIILMHDAKRYGEWQRVSTFLNKVQPYARNVVNSPVYLLRFDTISGKNDFYKMNPGFDSLVTASLAKQERDPKLVNKSRIAASKVFTFDYKTCHANLSRGWKPSGEDFDEDSGGVYTHVDKFYGYINFYGQSREEFKTQLEILEKIGAPIDTLWGLRPSVIDKVCANPDWVSYGNYVKEKLAAYLAKQNINGKAQDAATLNKLAESIKDSNDKVIGRLINLRTYGSCYAKVIPFLKPDSPMRKYFEEYGKVASIVSKKDEFNERVIALFEKAGGKMEDIYGANPPVGNPKVADFMDLALKMGLRYPLLGFSDNVLITCPEVFADYINDIDSRVPFTP